MRLRVIQQAIVCCLLAGFAVVSASAESDFTGSWSGSFDIHFADGRVIHDTGPIRDVSTSGNELKFVADSTQGKSLSFSLKRAGERLSGEALGDIGDDHVRVVIDVMRTGNAAAGALTPDALYQKLLALDTAMFDAFNKCSDPAQLKKNAAFFANDLEFYHDLGGVTLGVEAMMASTRQNVCGQFHRELDLASFRVYPIPGYGAMSMGTHRFCHTPTTCEGVGEFTMVWREKDGAWQITRALSYAHRSLPAGK